METSNTPKRKIDPGLLVGLIAILINIITVSVYMYQTSIMQSQQQVSAWPYLERLESYTDDKGFQITLKNNGIGPAIIKSVKIKWEGQEVEHIDSLFTKIVGTTLFPHIIGRVENRVLPAGEAIIVAKVNDLQLSEKIFYTLHKGNFEYNVCYESVYGEAWTCKGLEVIDGCL